MSRQNTSVVLAERPVDSVIPGQTFSIQTGPAPTASDLKDGELLVEVIYISIDPAMRGWLNDLRSYVPPVPIGGVMRSHDVCRVLAVGPGVDQANTPVEVGDFVSAAAGWTEVAVVSASAVQNFRSLVRNLPVASHSLLKPSDLISTLGMTALTAYFGIEKIAEGIRPTDTVVVSGAAGATGSIAAQIAKLKGAKKVIGIAGSDEKCRWLVEDLGLDVALNYKDPDFAAEFKKATPEFIDVFWDNVGGEILDLALTRAAVHSRFIMCGGISQYNTHEVKGPRNILQIIAMRIKMQGFIVFDYASEYPRARQDLAQWLADGKLKRQETIVKGGLQVVEKTLVDLFHGANLGKLLVEVKNLTDTSRL